MLNRLRGIGVILLNSQIEQVARVSATAVERFYRGNDNFQRGALSSQRLRFFRVIPDAGLSELQLDFFQTVFFYSVVKDTPSARRYARGGL